MEGRVPVVLIVDDQEWRARSLESVLGPSGFVVVKAYTGGQSAELATRVDPDLVIVDFHLPDTTGCAVIRAVREAGPAGSATPCLILSSEPLTRSDRLACLEAGAWDILSPPLDSEEILLKVRTFVEAKRRHDSVGEQGLLDSETGCYNVKGLVTRLEEFSADAARWHRPLACVAIAFSGDAQHRTDAMLSLTRQLRERLRSSDALGRLPQGELAVLAPATDPPGALRLAERISAGMVDKQDADAEVPEDLRIGVYAVSADDASGISAAPEEMLSRAIQALRKAQKVEDRSHRISSYRN